MILTTNYAALAIIDTAPTQKIASEPGLGRLVVTSDQKDSFIVWYVDSAFQTAKAQLRHVSDELYSLVVAGHRSHLLQPATCDLWHTVKPD